MPPHEDHGSQDAFLSHLRDQGAEVTAFLVNGIRLQGRITDFDRFIIILTRGGKSQVVYKHAISTIDPSASGQRREPSAVSTPDAVRNGLRPRR